MCPNRNYLSYVTLIDHIIYFDIFICAIKPQLFCLFKETFYIPLCPILVDYKISPLLDNFIFFVSKFWGLRAVIPYFDSYDLTTLMQYAVPPVCFPCERRPLLYQKLPMLVGSF